MIAGRILDLLSERIGEVTGKEKLAMDNNTETVHINGWTGSLVFTACRFLDV